MLFSEPIRVLSRDDMQRIHDAALQILEQVGMKIDHPDARQILKKKGCNVDDGTGLVRFPRKLVQESVDQMRRAYATRQVPQRMGMRYSHIRFRSEPHRIHEDFTVSAGGFCCFICDFDGNRRNAALDDVHRAISMVNHLVNVDLTGLPVSDQTMDATLRPVAMAGELAKYTTKFGGVETFRKEDIAYLIDIASVIKGSEAAVKAEPILVGYSETRTPLCYDRNMVEIFMEYIRRGFPQSVDTMPNSGATAPMTAAGTLALGVAETLAPVALGLAINPDAIVTVDVTPSTCDMQSGLYRYSSPERWTMLIARVQMISEYYGCPSGVHGGKTDSCFFDEHAGYEKGLSMLMPILAGAVGIGTVGHLENAVTFSPVQLVLDAEMARGIRTTLRGIEVNDDTLALDLIKQVGPGGNYLETEHTAMNFRKEQFISSIFPHLPWDLAHSMSNGAKDRAEAKARELWAQKPEPVIDPQQIKEIDAIVARAKRDIGI